MSTQNQAQSAQTVESKTETSMTTQDQNLASTVESQNTEAMETQNQSAQQLEFANLSTEELSNLMERFDENITQVDNNTLRHELLQVDLSIRQKNHRVVVQHDGSGESFSFERRFLQSDEVKKKKQRKLANKASQVISSALSFSKREERVEQDIQWLKNNLNTGFFNSKVSDIQRSGDGYIAYFNNEGYAGVVKDNKQFRLSFIHIFKDKKIG
jgi:hypothetical protein